MKKIIIAASNGFIGSYLMTYFADKGYEVIGLVRKPIVHSKGLKYVLWDGKNLGAWQEELEGAFAVINLAGRTVDCRYNETNKEEIYRSRLESTKILGQAIERCTSKPSFWLNAASATIYRHSENNPMTEENGEIGYGFSVDVCQKWEQMFFSFDHLETKLIGLRIAITLGEHGGVMVPFRRLTKCGLGGKMGNGNQMFSWINILDLARSLEFIMTLDQPERIYNIAHPKPMTNAKFMSALRKKYGIPFGIPLPRWVLEIGARVIQTETELILKSRFVIPERLIKSGFQFEVNEV